MTKTPRQRAFEVDAADWAPGTGEVVFVRSKDQHLSRVCGRGTVTDQSMFVGELVEVTLRAGQRVRSDVWNVEDLRPCKEATQ